MSDNPNGQVLDYLREQFARVNGKLDRLSGDMAEIKQRLTTVEIQVGNLAGTEGSHYAQVMLRMDRLDARVERIEQRLDLVDGAAA